MTNADETTAELGDLDHTAELDYAGALTELDTILAELEDETLNVDILADRVGRASELISFCRTRIRDAQLHVEQIVADIDTGDDDESD